MSQAVYLPIGLVVLVINVYGVIKPYKLAKLFEQIDAIGSKRRNTSVEPTNWNVILIRITSLVMAISSGVYVVLLLGALR